MGLALPDCRAHSPNENFPLENFEGGIRLEQSNPARAGVFLIDCSVRCPQRIRPIDAFDSPLRTADTTASNYEMASDSCDLVWSC